MQNDMRTPDATNMAPVLKISAGVATYASSILDSNGMSRGQHQQYESVVVMFHVFRMPVICFLDLK